MSTLSERLIESPDDYVTYRTDAGEALHIPKALFDGWTPTQQRWANARLVGMEDPNHRIERALEVYKRRSADITWKDRFARWLDERVSRGWGYRKGKYVWVGPTWLNALRYLVYRTGFYNRFILGKFA